MEQLLRDDDFHEVIGIKNKEIQKYKNSPLLIINPIFESCLEDSLLNHICVGNILTN